MQNAILAWLQKTGIDGWMLDGPSWLKWIRYKLTGLPGVQFLYPPAEVTIVVSQSFVRDSKGWVVVRQYNPLFPAVRSAPSAVSGAPAKSKSLAAPLKATASEKHQRNGAPNTSFIRVRGQREAGEQDRGSDG